MSYAILVTGASGLLGANFVLAAMQRLDNIAALCYPESLGFPGIKTIRLDLTDFRASKDLVL